MNASQRPPDTDKPKTKRGRKKKMIVAGLAASAGGLEALGQLIGHLPRSSVIAYVVVQHMAPQHRSMLTQLLARQTEMTVVEIKDGMAVEPNVIYITPPNADLDIRDGILHLRQPHAAIGPKPSADYFFSSLAEDQGENSIGIILSGTGSDGAHGVRAIKAAGGITMAQDDDSARYNGMPRAAIDTGCIDFVLPPERMGPELTDLVVRPRRATLPKEDEPDDDLTRLLRMVKTRHGIDFASYKQSTILRRLKRRMAAVRVETLDAYLAYVSDHPGELEQLRNDILISVTSFFRDAGAFDALREVLPGLLEAKEEGDTIRIWVAGCASGEEAYSLAILLCEELGGRIHDHPIQIFATDVDADALARARKGVYPDAALKGMSAEMIDRYFVARGGFFQVVKSVRDMIVFARHDVIQDPPFLRMDLISCRNLLIYFTQALQTKVLNIFHYVLNPGCYLMLGKSESTTAGGGHFHTVDKRWKLYRRLGDGRPVTREATFTPDHRPPEPTRPVAHRREPSLGEIVQRALVEAFAPPSVIVDSSGRIVNIQGDMADFLSLGQGQPDLNVHSMARQELRGEVRSVLVRAQRSMGLVTGGAVPLPGSGDDGDRHVRVAARPLNNGQEWLFLISFEAVEAPQPAIGGAAGQEGMDNARLHALEQELAATRENLQTVVQELETSNEELQSLNEELQASNEELQSSNEEYETSNEELQSTNEELTTVNQELQVKSAELAAVNEDLEHVLKSLGFPLVVVDRTLRVTRFTPPARRIFDLVPEDVGSVLTSVACRIDLPNLRDILRSVIEEQEPCEMTLPTDGPHRWMRITPVRDDDGLPSGAVLIFGERAAAAEPPVTPASPPAESV